MTCWGRNDPWPDRCTYRRLQPGQDGEGVCLRAGGGRGDLLLGRQRVRPGRPAGWDLPLAERGALARLRGSGVGRGRVLGT